MTGIEKLGNYTGASLMIENAIQKSESSKFADMLKKVQERGAADYSHISSEQVLDEGRINGDYKTGFAGAFKSEADKNAPVTGAAANQAGVHSSKKTIDKTSKLYEKSLEMESFFVKMMVDSMRKTVTSSTKHDFAHSMYQDMLYDEYTTALTKNAGFGIADQIYLELSGN